MSRKYIKEFFRRLFRYKKFEEFRTVKLRKIIYNYEYFKKMQWIASSSTLNNPSPKKNIITPTQIHLITHTQTSSQTYQFLTLIINFFKFFFSDVSSAPGRRRRTFRAPGRRRLLTWRGRRPQCRKRWPLIKASRRSSASRLGSPVASRHINKRTTTETETGTKNHPALL